MSVQHFADLPIEQRAIGGGVGEATFHHLVTKEGLFDKGRLFAHLSIPVGGTVGVHPHAEEAEYYYILSGQGTYLMDDQTYLVGPGDVCEVQPGHSHGLINTGDETLDFIALIVFA